MGDSVYLTSIEGNRQWLDGGAMFGNVPRAMWEKWVSPDPKGRIPLATRALLVETENKKILCETGIGAFLDTKLADRFGVENAEQHELLNSLRNRGISPLDIDFVILSHLHFDHAGGLLSAFQSVEKGIVFKNAQLLVGEKAYQRATNPHPRDIRSFPEQIISEVCANEKLTILGRNGKNRPKDLPDGIDFWYSDGHTPGQMHTIVRGTTTSVVFVGDLIPGRWWVHLPVTMGYDRFPELLIDEKAELYRLMSEENWLAFYTHDPDFCASKIILTNQGKYEARDCQRSYVRHEI